MAKLTLLAVIHVLFIVPSAAQEVSFRQEPLLGSFSAVSEMKPNVVVNFLSSCTGIPVNTSSCLVANFLYLTYPQRQWGNPCLAPFADDYLRTKIVQALDRCPYGSVTQQERGDLLSVMKNMTCNLQLCTDDSIFYTIESQWMKQCAGISIPLPTVAAEDSDEDEDLLACMVHDAMSSPPPFLQLPEPREGSKEICYPRGYTYMNAICRNGLARYKLAQCLTKYNFTTYTFATSRNTGGSGPENDGDYFTRILSRFCSLMVNLSSGRGRACLEPLCDHQDETIAPSWNVYAAATSAPTYLPTRPPTTTPSTSSSPSSGPTLSPNAPPSISPSAEPSSIPSAPPSISPSTEPSLAPSEGPSSKPSQSPTGPPHDISAGPWNVVEIQFFTVVAIQNITTEDCSSIDTGKLTEKALIDALSNVLGPMESNVTIQVVPMECKSLDGSLDVELQVDMIRTCPSENCELSDEMLANFVMALEEAINSGELTKAIQQESDKNHWEALKYAYVAPGQTQFVRYSVSVRESKELVSKAFTAASEYRFQAAMILTVVSMFMAI